MKSNMGNIDRTLRIVVGLIALALGLYFKTWWGAVGLIPLLTSFIKWCPLYAPFKISTRKAQ